MQSKNHMLINGAGTPEDDKDLSITSVLMDKLINPPLHNGILGKADIVTVNGNGVIKHPSSSSDDFDNDVSPGALYNDSRGSVGSFSTLEGKSLSNINEAWCDTNNNSTSDISELSISDSLLCEMDTNAVTLNTPANSSAANESVMKYPAVCDLTNGTIKQRSKSESPSSSLKRNRKISAPTIDSSVSMEIPNVEDDDDEVTEDFSLRRSKYAPIRRKRISLAGSCPSLEIRDLGPVPKQLGRLEEFGETDGSLKSSPGPLGKPTKRPHYKSPISTTPHTQTKPIVHHKSVDEVDKPQDQPAQVKRKSDLVTTKPPLPISKTDSSGGPKQRRKSVKGLFFPKKMSRKSSSSPVEAIVEQPAKDVTKPKVKKATRRAPLGSIISRLSPKRDIPSKDDQKHDGSKKEEAKHKQPRKLSMTKTDSLSGGSLVSKTSSSSSTRSTETFQGQKSSSFTVTKEPLKSSPSEISFASREASISIESLLSDGSTDILMADSNYDLFCSSSREDLLDDSMSSSHHLHTTSEPLLSDVHQPEDTPLKLEDITLFTDEDDTGPAPAIMVTSPVKNQDKKLVAVKKDSPDVVHVREVDSNLYRAKSMEVLGSSKMMTDVEVLTSNTQSSNLPSTISVSTENLSSSSKRKSGIFVSTVKKCVSLDLLAASKKQAPTTTITVSSKKTPTKAKPTPLTSSVHKAEEKKKDVQEKATSLQVRDKGTVKSEIVTKSKQTPVSSPAMTRQGSGRKLSGSSSPFMRTSSRSSTGRKKSTTVTHESKLNISTRSSSPAKKTTIVIKSSRVNTTPSKVTVIGNTATSTKLTDHGNAQRVASPAKSSMRRPSMQRVSSGRKKSTEKVTVKSPVTQSPSPQQRKVPFISLFPAGDVRRISRVSSDEVPANNVPKNDMVHLRSSSEVVSNNTLDHAGALSDIVEDKMLITSSVETLASDRVASSMSDTTALQKTVPTEAPVRRISSGPVSNNTMSSSHTAPGSQAPVRKKSVTGRSRPQSARGDHHNTTGQHHSTIGQHHSDSVLKRPSSAATRRTSSTMKPSVSGTMPRQLTKTKSDSKIGFSTLPRARRVSETVVSPEMAPSKKSVRPHSAVSRGGLQATARSSARRISLAPTSSAGKITRSSAARRSKSIVTIPDASQLKPNEDSKTDEDDGAKLSTSAGGAKLKPHDLNRKNSTALRSSLRRPSTANRQTDTSNMKDARQSPARSSRRSIHHSVAAKATSVAAVSHVSTPSRKASVAGRTNSGSSFSTPKLDASVSMSDLDSIKSADKYVYCTCVCVIVWLPHVSVCYPM